MLRDCISVEGGVWRVGWVKVSHVRISSAFLFFDDDDVLARLTSSPDLGTKLSFPLPSILSNRCRSNMTLVAAGVTQIPLTACNPAVTTPNPAVDVQNPEVVRMVDMVVKGCDLKWVRRRGERSLRSRVRREREARVE